MSTTTLEAPDRERAQGATKQQTAKPKRTRKPAGGRVGELLAKDERIKLAVLIDAVVCDAIDEGAEQLTKAEMARLGDPIVKAGLLIGYTAAKYDRGRWVGAATLKAACARFAERTAK